MVLLSGEEKTEYEEQKKAGVYDIDVKLYLRIRFKFGKVKTWRLKPKVKCDLKVPISAVGFKRTKCDIDF